MKKMKLALLSVIGSMLMLTTASATAVLSSGPVFIFGQATAVCHLTNISTFTARVVTLQIIEHGTNTVVASNNCGNMAGNGYCNAVANSLQTVPYSCKASVGDDSVNLRGNLDVRIQSQETRITAPLR